MAWSPGPSRYPEVEQNYELFETLGSGKIFTFIVLLHLYNMYMHVHVYCTPIYMYMHVHVYCTPIYMYMHVHVYCTPIYNLQCVQLHKCIRIIMQIIENYTKSTVRKVHVLWQKKN